MSSLSMAPIKAHFRYPENDRELLTGDCSSDFLRNPADSQNRVDPNYILNQRDAANYFIDQFWKVQSFDFKELTREQHKIACLGLNGNRAYRIPINHGKWLSPKQISKDIIIYDNIDANWRQAYPGKFRHELVREGKPHPTMDILSLTKESFSMLKDTGLPNAVMNIDWAFDSESHIHSASDANENSGFSVDILGAPNVNLVSIPILTNNSGGFAREVATGAMENDLLEHAKYYSVQVHKEIVSAGLNLVTIIKKLGTYYHAAINWMPFTNVNNSLFMAQINTVLRAFASRGIPHGDLDTMALLSSPDAFVSIFLNYVKNYIPIQQDLKFPRVSDI